MVGNLEHIDRGQVRMRHQQRLLGGRFQVAEEQQGQARRTDQKGHARVVRPLLRRGGGRGVGRGPQDLPGQRARPAPLARPGRHHRHPCRRGPAPHGRGLAGRLRQSGRLDRPHRAAAQHPGQSGHMVGMKVGEDEQRDADHAQRPQTAVDGPWLGTGVHDDGRAGTRGQDQGVPLAHIAGHDPPAGRRPTGDDPGQRRRADHREQQEQRTDRPQPPVPQQTAPQKDGDQGDRRQQQPAGPAARPARLRTGKPRAGAGHPGDPLGGPARGPGDPPGDRKRERGHRERGGAEDHGGPHRQLGEQIAGDRHQAHPRGHHHHHRRAHRLRRRGGRQHLGRSRRHPTAPQGGAPRRREGEQRAGGQGGEHEPVAAGQPRVVQQQRQDRGGQGGEQGTAAPGADGQQRDQPACRRPQHAGVGAADDHEAERERSAEQGRRPEPHAERRGQPAPLGPRGEVGRARQQRQQKCEIAAGDGQQMCHVRGPERLVEVRRHP